jgi:transcriptional regulator with XRE-family HTH domain
MMFAKSGSKCSNSNFILRRLSLMLNLGERIRRIRKLKAISQVELENKTGIKREYLSKIENSELKNPTYNTLLKICGGLGISLKELVDVEKEPQLRKEPPLKVLTDPGSVSQVTPDKYMAVPLISRQTAMRGVGHIDVKEIERYVVVSLDYVEPTTDTSRYRCVRLAEGDQSMSPAIEPGTIVGIDSYQTEPKDLDGKLVFMRLKGEKCGVRRLKVQENYVVALPQNLKDYNPLVLSLSQKRQILGRVVWCLSKFDGDD